MRHGTSGRRSRNRNGGGGGGGGGNGGGGVRRGNQGRTQVFDSNGPDVRIRGTAHQIHEKYVILAKDAESIGDRILAESYLQHAEHYQRVINSWHDSAENRSSENSRPAAFDQDATDSGFEAHSVASGADARQTELADA